MAPLADPGAVGSPFMAALVGFWKRVEPALRGALPDLDARLAPLGALSADLEQLLRCPLDVEVVCRIHAEVTRDQAAVAAKLADGTWRHVAFARGVFKDKPNELVLPDGTVQDFCPPERTRGELERILKLYGRIPEQLVEVRAAWLQLGVMSVHPFVDGNGRAARALSFRDFLRAGLPAPRTSMDAPSSSRSGLVAAFEGDLAPLAAELRSEAEHAVLQQLRAAEVPPRIHGFDAVARERVCIDSIRSSSATDFATQLARLDDLAASMTDALLDVPDEVQGRWRLEHTTVDAGAVERLLAWGTRVRHGAPALSAHLELGGTWLDGVIDVVPLGALGLGAWVAAVTVGQRRVRDRTPLLLLPTEDEAAQRERLRSWLLDAVVDALVIGIGYGQ